MYGVLRRLGCELGATLLRMCAYIGAIAMLGLGIAKLLEGDEVSAAIDPSPRSEWVTVERPYRAFALNGPNLSDTDYAIRRHAAGGRKDVLSVGAEDGAPARLMVEIYRQGGEADGFAPAEAEAAARIPALGRTHMFRQVEAIDSKFGRVTVFEFTAHRLGHARNCLAFVRAFDEPRLQIAGWHCMGNTEVVERRTLACALEGLSLLAAASDPKVQQLVAAAEQKRTFCSSPRAGHARTCGGTTGWPARTGQSSVRA